MIPVAAGARAGRNEEVSPGISHLPITQAGVPAFARTRGFRAQPAPVCLPSKEWKMCSLNPGTAPSYGLSCVWGQCESPWAIQGMGIQGTGGDGDRGHPRHPEPIPALQCPFPGAGAGWGQCPTLAPSPGCVAAADVPPVPGALRGAGRMQALLCISN